MSKVIAVAAVQDNPFKAAALSAENLLKLVADFMYGTNERARLTYLFATGLFMLAYALQVIDPALLQNCPI